MIARTFDDLSDLYSRLIVSTGKQQQFLVLSSFLVTFLTARGLAWAIREGRLRLARNIVVRETHVHHLVPGILLLLVAGYLSVVLVEPPRALLALLFGAGAALTLDEFALWLHLEDVYWHEKGRRSLDAVVVTAVVFSLFTLHVDFWLRLSTHAARLTGLLV